MQPDERLHQRVGARSGAEQLSIVRIEVKRAAPGEEHERVRIIARQADALHARVRVLVEELTHDLFHRRPVR